jgi:hypothetical protein
MMAAELVKKRVGQKGNRLVVKKGEYLVEQWDGRLAVNSAKTVLHWACD